MTCDGIAKLRDIDERLVSEIGTIGPFGPGNPDVRFFIERAIIRSAKSVGDGTHLKFEVEDESGAVRGAIAFGKGNVGFAEGQIIALLARPIRNEWKGRVRIELEVEQMWRLDGALSESSATVESFTFGEGSAPVTIVPF